MNAIEWLVHNPAAEAVGWALLQFVWQGSLVGLATAALLVALRRGAADVRYVVSAIGLAVMFTMPVVTAVQSWRTAAAAPRALGSALDSVQVRNSRSGPGPVLPLLADDSTSGAASPARAGGETPVARNAVESSLPALLIVWCCGVSMLTIRLMVGWLSVQRIKHHSALAAGDRWQRAAERLSRRLHLSRRVRLFESTRVDVPTVIGWMKPVVLLPVSALAGLTPEQLEAILAHELAHIRRHDYLVNLLQTLVETLLFYHPAVWWLSHRIRVERENCCDDLAVTLCGDPYAYARALADLEALRSDSPTLALAATGGSLLHRVRRLIGAPAHDGRDGDAYGWVAAGAAVALMGAIAASAPDSGVLRAQQETPQGSAPATAPVRATTPTPATSSERPAASASAAAAQADAATTRAQEMAQRSSAAAAAIAASCDAAEARAADLARLASAAIRPVQAARAHEALAAEMAGARASLERTGAVLAAQAAALASAMPVLGGQDHQGSGNFVWSDDGRKLEVKYRGRFDFTDDDTDVRSLSPGGYLEIRDDGWFAKDRRIEFRADSNGNITRRFFVAGSERPFDPEGRQWLAQALPRLVRQTGFGAPARVARILKNKGVDGVLTEISLIQGSWAKRVYFNELLKAAPLDAQGARKVLAQASRELGSDFELASLLIAGADKLMVDESTRRAYVEATRSIESDFELRRVLSAALRKTGASPQVVASVLDASLGIESDFEAASLLVQIAGLQPLDETTRGPFFKALGTVGGEFERGRVLKAVVSRSDVSQQTLLDVIRASRGMQGFQASQILLAVAAGRPLTGEARDAYIDAATTLADFEQGRVLTALVKNERRR